MTWSFWGPFAIQALKTLAVGPSLRANKCHQRALASQLKPEGERGSTRPCLPLTKTWPLVGQLLPPFHRPRWGGGRGRGHSSGGLGWGSTKGVHLLLLLLKSSRAERGGGVLGPELKRQVSQMELEGR